MDNNPFGMSDFDPFDTAPDDMPEYETARQLDNPRTHARREATRRFIADLKKRSLVELIPELPDENTVLYIISNGSGAESKWLDGGIDRRVIDLGHFIPHLVELLGGSGCTVYISTWTLNREHCGLITDMLADGRIERLTFFSDPYLRSRNPAVYMTLVGAIQRFSDRARLLLWKNHTKLICVANRDETRFCTLNSSANLSSQPRSEATTLDCHPDTYRFITENFFEVMLSNGS